MTQAGEGQGAGVVGLLRRGLRSGVVRVQRRAADLAPAERARGRRDWPASVAAVPALAELDGQIDALAARFADDHARYCREVGHPVHAASLELVGLLVGLVQHTRPRRVIDLGSGFSSYVLRTLAAEAGAPIEVHSVDDSPEWLEKTRGYLRDKGVSDAGLFTWADFGAAGRAGGYDLVLHDMGFMDTRFATLDAVVDLARPGGLVLLDDMHKPDYRDKALARLGERGLRPLSLRRLTHDALTRFAYLLPR